MLNFFLISRDYAQSGSRNSTNKYLFTWDLWRRLYILVRGLQRLLGNSSVLFVYFQISELPLSESPDHGI